MRFYFHILDGADGRDEEGIELCNLESAREQAVCGARAMIAEAVCNGTPVDLGQAIEVTDGAGTVLFSIGYREIVTVLG